MGHWVSGRHCRKCLARNTREQRCWVHKTANVLNKLPKHLQPKAKSDLHQIWMAQTRENARLAFDPRSCRRMSRNTRRRRSAWLKTRRHCSPSTTSRRRTGFILRTTNPIESTFATVRLRTAKSRGCGSRASILSTVFKLAQSAELRWLNICVALRCSAKSLPEFNSKTESIAEKERPSKNRRLMKPPYTTLDNISS